MGYRWLKKMWLQVVFHLMSLGASFAVSCCNRSSLAAYVIIRGHEIARKYPCNRCEKEFKKPLLAGHQKVCKGRYTSEIRPASLGEMVMKWKDRALLKVAT